jgi:hypothetical protein
MRVVLVYPDDGGTREVLLAGVPQRGDYIRVANGPGGALLVVERVTWTEGTGDPPEPTIIVAVRARA